MVITQEVNLPDFQTLTVEEADVSQATLMSAANYVGKACEAVNNEFMLCRQELKDPRPCIDLGKRVTECALKVLRQIKKECLNEFNQYAHCIDKSSGDFSYTYCRKTQGILDQCVADKLGICRPDFGYFCRARVHESSRLAPPPSPCPCEPLYPDATPSLPDCKPRREPRFGSRLYWMTE